MAGIGQALARAFAALLLAFAIASPAVAEIACAADSIAHAAPVAAEDHHAQDEADGDHETAPDPENHCAFSHGHCGGLAGVGALSVEGPAPPLSFRLLSDRDVRSLRPHGPERPPRA